MKGQNKVFNNLTADKFYIGNSSKIDEIVTSIAGVTPANDQIPTVKAVSDYVASSVTSMAWKEPVVVASTVALTLATGFAEDEVIDGVTLVAGDRILIKDQADASENGIYIVTAAAPTRATDADTAAKLTGATVLVEGGSVGADLAYTNTVSAPVVGTDDITFVKIAGTGAVFVTATQTLTNKTLTSPKINEDVAVTATATELNQLDDVTVGGTTTGDIVDIDTAQLLTNKMAVSLNIADALTEPFMEIKSVDANSGALSGATGTITVDIPAGALLIGVTLNNDVATVDDAGDDTYTAAFSGGSSISIGAGIAATINTKTKTFIDANSATAITSDVTQITLTPNGGNFTAGDIRAVVVYAVMKDLADQA